MEPIITIYIKEEPIAEDTKQEDSVLTPTADSDHNFQESKNTEFKDPSLIELACSSCADTFPSWCYLTKHVFSHISAISTPLHVCAFCSGGFENTAQVYHHQYTSETLERGAYCDCKSNFHLTEQQDSTTELGNNSIAKDAVIAYRCRNRFKYQQSYSRRQSEEMLTLCELGETSIIQSSYLEKHPKIHTGDVPCSSDIGKESSTLPQSLKIHQSINSGEQAFSCKNCGKPFKPNLKTHKKNRPDGRPYFCEICGKSFTRSAHLKGHHMIHSGERPFSCEVCGRSFIQSGDLKKHGRIHSGERPFPCTICGISFAQSGTLKEHQRIHFGERPFSCEVCGKAFTQSGNLKKHQKIHSSDRAISCEVCGISFTRSDVFKEHMREHSRQNTFSCQLCKKSFSRSVYLKRHLQNHSGERRFSCELCGKSFTQVWNLKAHQRLHSGERLFTCPFCGKSFTHFCYLKKHQKTHSAEWHFLFKPSEKFSAV